MFEKNCMNRKLALLAAAITIFATFTILAVVLRTTEDPQFAGRPLSAWLHLYSKSKSTPDIHRIEAEAAIRSIGTNALPLILRRLHGRDAATKLFFMRLFSHPKLVRWRPISASDLCEEALDGLSVLGPISAPLIPELVNGLAAEEKSIECRRSGDALSRIGAPAAQFVGPVAIHGKYAARFRAFGLLRQMGPDALPYLFACLNDDDTFIRSTAAATIAAAGCADFEILVQLYSARLSDPNSFTRRSSAYSLGALGPRAAAGIPALENAIRDPHTRVRKEAMRALQRIRVKEQ